MILRILVVHGQQWLPFPSGVHRTSLSVEKLIGYRLLFDATNRESDLNFARTEKKQSKSRHVGENGVSADPNSVSPSLVNTG